MKRPSQPELNTKVQPEIDVTDDDNLSRISYTLKPPPSSRMSRKEDALSALKEDYDNLVPRWKGVVLTAEAEIALEREIKELASGKNEARRMKEGKANFPKPWANIKFSQFIGNGGTKAKTIAKIICATHWLFLPIAEYSLIHMFCLQASRERSH